MVFFTIIVIPNFGGRFLHEKRTFSKIFKTFTNTNWEKPKSEVEAFCPHITYYVFRKIEFLVCCEPFLRPGLGVDRLWEGKLRRVISRHTFSITKSDVPLNSIDYFLVSNKWHSTVTKSRVKNGAHHYTGSARNTAMVYSKFVEPSRLQTNSQTWLFVNVTTGLTTVR